MQIRSTPFTEESDESSEDDGASTNEENDSGTDAIVPVSPSRSRSRDVKRKQPQNHNTCTSGAVKRGNIWRHLSLIVKKLVFRVSDQVRHKQGCIVTEDG